MDVKQVRQYLLYVISQGVSSSYVNGCYSALRFLYETTLNQNWNMKSIPRSKKQSKLPVVLSPQEVLSIFDVVSNLKHKSILMTTYDADLRVSETANLLLLREYWQHYKPSLYLFPGATPEKPIANRTIQQVFYDTRIKAGINKKASVHSLRHSFASHFLETGTDLFRIQHFALAAKGGI